VPVATDTPIDFPEAPLPSRELRAADDPLPELLELRAWEPVLDAPFCERGERELARIELACARPRVRCCCAFACEPRLRVCEPPRDFVVDAAFALGDFVFVCDAPPLRLAAVGTLLTSHQLVRAGCK
jgi:hypothetical protein